MKVSIITVSYNDLTGLEETLLSVSEQTYGEIEHIVVDGGTKDLDVSNIKRLKKFSGIFISEPDRGIYDAMNKGINNASGRYIAFLNSGDVYADNRVIEEYVKTIYKNNFPSAVYAHLKFMKNTKCIRSWYVKNFNKKKFLLGWMMPHPTVFARSDILSSSYQFDTNLRIASDYDWMLRTFYFSDFKPKLLNKVTVLMQAGGVSNSSFRSILASNIEVLKCWNKYTYLVPIWLIFLKPLMKLTQVFK